MNRIVSYHSGNSVPYCVVLLPGKRPHKRPVREGIVVGRGATGI